MARRDLAGQGRPRGRRPLLLDPHLSQQFLTAIRNGLPLGDACALAGVSAEAVRTWLFQGRAARERAAAGTPPELWDELYVGFLGAVELARADLATECLEQIRQAAAGGYVTKVRRWRDKHGNLIEETEHQPPQWQAAKWILERTRREAFGAHAQAFLDTQPDTSRETGSPTAENSIAADLAARLAALRERVALEQAAAAGDIAEAHRPVQDAEPTS